MRNLLQSVSLSVLIFFNFGSMALAKDCTEADIRAAISTKKHFDFDEESCADKPIFLSKGIELSGGIVIDGKNKMQLSWVGEGAQCDEFPRGSAFASFYTTGNDNVMKNFIILLSPEGIHLDTGSGNIVDNVTFERICEDAITNGNKHENSATKSIIRKSRFNNGPDKAIQCNGGSVTVESSEFHNIPRAIGTCTFLADPGFHVAKECPIPCHINAFKNKVYGCRKYAFRGAGYLQGQKQGSLTAIDNYFKDCKNPIVADQYGYIYAEKNRVEGRCEKFALAQDHSTGDVCDNKTSCLSLASDGISQRCIPEADRKKF